MKEKRINGQQAPATSLDKTGLVIFDSKLESLAVAKVKIGTDPSIFINEKELKEAINGWDRLIGLKEEELQEIFDALNEGGYALFNVYAGFILKDTANGNGTWSH